MVLKIRAMDGDDKRFFIASVIAPVVLWWVLVGRKKYTAKGMK